MVPGTATVAANLHNRAKPRDRAANVVRVSKPRDSYRRCRYCTCSMYYSMAMESDTVVHITVVPLYSATVALTRSLGIAAVRANARMRMRVLSRASLGGKSVPVGSAKDENKHFEEAERENYRRHGPRARAAFAAHSNNCI